MARRSCLYVGRVNHRRRGAVEHAFAFPLFLFYLDLDELDEVFAGRVLASHRRKAWLRFRREDHFGDPDQPLADAVRDEVARQTGRRPLGPVRLLTQLRHAGYVFNPISVFYCFAADGETLEAVLAEVTSTPWHERHLYALPWRHEGGGSLAPERVVEQAKAMHVSPFLPMSLDYRFFVRAPGDDLSLAIECRDRDGERVFDATLALRRRPLDTASLLGAVLRFPLLTFQVIAAIHWQALRLWWKGAPFHPHPGRTNRRAEVTR